MKFHDWQQISSKKNLVTTFRSLGIEINRTGERKYCDAPGRDRCLRGFDANDLTGTNCGWKNQYSPIPPDSP